VEKKNYKIKKIPIIKNFKGNLFKIISKDHVFYNKFGEIYLSEVRPGKFKGWKYHENRTQIITVIAGKVRFFFKKKITDKATFIDIGYPNNLYLLKIEKKTYYSFKCKSKTRSLIINLIDEIVK
jgi:dTDP-4-dehydrorhamnose 3,5-epimerase-like enzyme